MFDISFCYIEMEDIEDHHSDSDESLIAVTQKSIMLSDMLAQKAFTNPNRNNSSAAAANNQSDKSSSLVSIVDVLHIQFATIL